MIQITVDEEVKNGILKVKNKFGRLNAVINCAGISFNSKTFSFNKQNRTQKSTVESKLKKVLEVRFFFRIIGSFVYSVI